MKLTIIINAPVNPDTDASWSASMFDGASPMGRYTMSAAQAADEQYVCAMAADAYPTYDEFEIQYPDGVPVLSDTSNGGGGPGPRQ